ncbi:hypothetical protein B0H11DRAFT_2051174 [Mycena galericulata]|nr:hypothetical protein B0H11DRAFT_2051174 [Mycena galericulata]
MRVFKTSFTRAITGIARVSSKSRSFRSLELVATLSRVTSAWSFTKSLPESASNSWNRWTILSHSSRRSSTERDCVVRKTRNSSFDKASTALAYVSGDWREHACIFPAKRDIVLRVAWNFFVCFQISLYEDFDETVGRRIPWSTYRCKTRGPSFVRWVGSMTTISCLVFFEERRTIVERGKERKVSGAPRATKLQGGKFDVGGTKIEAAVEPVLNRIRGWLLGH